MSAIVIEQEPCYIYHVRAMQETSVILEVISLNYGSLHVFARGVKRQQSRYQGLFQPFVPLKLSMREGRKADGLFYLTQCEYCSEGYNFKMPDYFCGMYINELLHHLWRAKEQDLSLFASYVSTLEAIATRQQVEQHLRMFELNLLSTLGYGLSACDDEGNALKPHEHYRFCLSLGFLPIPESLLAMQQRLAQQQNTSGGAKDATTTGSIATTGSTVNATAVTDASADSSTATTSTDAMVDAAASAADSGLLFAKSKVRGRKLSDSHSSFGGQGQSAMNYVPWWQEQVRKGHAADESRILGQKLEQYGHELLGPVLLGSEVKDIVEQEFKGPHALIQAKHLTGSIIERLLHGREIESRRLYREYREMLAKHQQQAAAANMATAAPAEPTLTAPAPDATAAAESMEPASQAKAAEITAADFQAAEPKTAPQDKA